MCFCLLSSINSNVIVTLGQLLLLISHRHLPCVEMCVFVYLFVCVFVCVFVFIYVFIIRYTVLMYSMDFWATGVTNQSHIFPVFVFVFSLVCLCLCICVCVFCGYSGRGLLGSWCY